MLFPASHLADPPRVVITGAGVITALGQGWKANAQGFRIGRVAMRPVSLFDVSRQRVKMAAEVELPPVLPATHLGERDLRRMDRASKMLLLAAHEAWHQAGWTASDDLPLVLGTTSGGMSLGQDYYRQAVDMPRSGFDSLQALSPTQCRPFDAHRDGLALGEGAAVLTLETLPHASRRGAEILGEIVGYGAATDAHHLTQPHPNGDAAFASMTAASANACIEPGQIGYVNAHGTGTPLNDSAEAAAINRWAGTSVRDLSVSSTKFSIGHLLGGAGAVEALVCLMALREQWLPPTATLETPDPVCAFHLVKEPTDARIEYAMSNSFGFGGANATLIFRRWQ